MRNKHRATVLLLIVAGLLLPACSQEARIAEAQAEQARAEAVRMQAEAQIALYTAQTEQARLQANAAIAQAEAYRQAVESQARAQQIQTVAIIAVAIATATVVGVVVGLIMLVFFQAWLRQVEVQACSSVWPPQFDGNPQPYNRYREALPYPDRYPTARLPRSSRPRIYHRVEPR